MVRTYSALIAAVLVASIPGCARQDGYPNRPIVLICPWSAGGGTDRTSRQVAALLEQELGVPVNVVNATGGAGVTGHTRGALARPDGYTLTMMTVEINMLPHRGLTNISYRDFQPVSLLNCDASALFVRSDSEWQTLDQLEAAIRAEPGKYRASGTAKGGIWHLGFAGWLDAVGLEADDVIWVSINGSNPSLQELISGGVDMVACSLPEAASLIDSGKVRPLGVMADRRVEHFPDVPTLEEQGVDWTLTGWRGIGAPQGTPPEIVDKLVDALRRVTESQSYRNFMDTAGFDMTWGGPEEFGELMARVDDQFAHMLAKDEFSRLQTRQFGPMFFPAVLATLLAVVTVSLVATGGLGRDPEAAPLDRKGILALAGIVLWVTAYIWLAEWIGFVVLGTLLMVLLIWRLGTRLWVAAVVSAVLVPLCFQVFAVWLRVPLPRGWLQSLGW